jgi:hypothetical protein
VVLAPERTSLALKSDPPTLALALGQLLVHHRRKLSLHSARAQVAYRSGYPTKAGRLSSEDLLFREVQQSLGQLTLIVISHLSTLPSFERVVVLRGGHIVEDGNPDSFLSAKGGSSKPFASNAS